MSALSTRPLNVLVEGWRGINHSYGLVNQHQLLGLMKDRRFRLFHRDLPFARPGWSRTSNPPGFSPDDQTAIDLIADPGRQPIDCVYRICSPFRAIEAADRRRTVTFMITETGLTHAHFADGAAVDRGCFTREANSIQTSSTWSRDRLIDWGFPGDRIQIVPLGVDGLSFAPLPAADRAMCRGTLGVREDETLFFSVSAPFWNKGLDALIRAYARVATARARTRLIVKDQQDVYNVSGDEVLARVSATEPGLLTEQIVKSISFVHGNVSREILRLMYCAADCYVSAYRAEGFNLPVLEAIACGTPVVVTAGGATDDFCDERVALAVPGPLLTVDNETSGLRGRYIEPDVDGFAEAMSTFTSGADTRWDGRAAARAEIVERFSWTASVRTLARLLAKEPTPA